jgi:hypothetical protein
MANNTIDLNQLGLSDPTLNLPTAPAQPSKSGKVFGALAQMGDIASNFLGGGLLTGLTSAVMGDSPMKYLQLQQKMTNESRAFEAVSTVMKAKHDAAMDAIRNISR